MTMRIELLPKKFSGLDAVAHFQDDAILCNRHRFAPTCRKDNGLPVPTLSARISIKSDISRGVIAQFVEVYQTILFSLSVNNVYGIVCLCNEQEAESVRKQIIESIIRHGFGFPHPRLIIKSESESNGLIFFITARCPLLA
jgi:hypothetical protein